MEYITLVLVYEKLESTSKRLAKTKIIADFIKNIDSEDLSDIILLLQGKLYPNWDETKIGVASRLVVKALSKATGIPAQKIELEWKRTGDLGITAQNIVSKKSQSTLFSKGLELKKVISNFRKLATLEGEGSVDRKMQLIAELLTSAKPNEARYIIRTLLEDLRVGAGEGSLRDAIVWAYFWDEIGITYNEEEQMIEIPNRELYNRYVDAVQSCHDTTNDFSECAKIAKTKGLLGLQKNELTVGRPVKAMLALKVNDSKEAFERVGKPAEAEYKLDGFRMQIHKWGNNVRLFTRRLEDVTLQFPEVAKYIKESVKGEDFILDSEAVGYNARTGKYLPFQNISQRIKRKYNIDELSAKFPVELNIFDILFYDGKNLLNEQFQNRRELLEKIVIQKEKQIVLVKRMISSDENQVNDFFNESIKAGNEGLILKNLESPYKPGARVGFMVKLKSTMENLDLAIIGAEWGEGKRGSWLSSYTLACRDENGDLLEIGKVSTGLKEKEEEGLSFQEMTEMLKPLIISEKGREVKVKPEIVIEVAYEEIQKSPTYESGFALRFPRVVRLRSDERGTEDITGIDYVEELYYSQRKK